VKIVKVIGGLGNQLFQYAFSRALALKTGDQVFLDISSYSKAQHQIHNGFELPELFPIKYEIAEERDIHRLSTQPRSPLSKVRRKYFTKRTHYIDKIFRFNPQVFDLKGDWYLEGWWQDARYFDFCSDLIRKELTFIADPGTENRELAATFEKSRYSLVPVSLHVRRGDALQNPDTWVCTEAYYRHAIEAARQAIRVLGRVARPYFLVFSDDLAWCMANLALEPSEAIYVDWNRGANSWRDMWLMSQCRIHIIANSTFSWWGAWLDQHPDKIVYAPEHWSLARPRRLAYYRYTFDDIVPQDWQRLPIV